MKPIVQLKVLSKEIGWASAMLKYREGMQDLSIALKPFCRKQASKEGTQEKGKPQVYS